MACLAGRASPLSSTLWKNRRSMSARSQRVTKQALRRASQTGGRSLQQTEFRAAVSRMDVILHSGWDPRAQPAREVPSDPGNRRRVE